MGLGRRVYLLDYREGWDLWDDFFGVPEDNLSLTFGLINDIDILIG